MRAGKNTSLQAVPSENELKIAQIQYYSDMADMSNQIAGLKTETEQIKIIMGIELGIIVATILASVIVYAVVLSPK